MNCYRLVLALLGWVGIMMGVHAGKSRDINIVLPTQSDHFVVMLPANPTTGYQWTLVSYDKKQFRLLSNTYVPEAPKRVGSGGKMHYSFSLIKPKQVIHKTKIQFVYKRPWEKTAGSTQTVWVSSNK